MRGGEGKTGYRIEEGKGGEEIPKKLAFHDLLLSNLTTRQPSTYKITYAEK